MSRTSSSRMQRPSQAELAPRPDDAKFVKESEVGGCSMIPQCFAPSMNSPAIKSALYSEQNQSLVWSENARFHAYDKLTGDTHRTPRNRLRWTVKCMVREVINGAEYLWTGHSNGEVCLWTSLGKLVGKPFTVAKTGITAMCLVRENVLWVGGVSGNIRVIKLDRNVTPFEIMFHTTVVPGLETTPRVLTNRNWMRPMQREPSVGLIESIPEGIAVPTAADKVSAVAPSGGSFAHRVRERAQALQWTPRAHSSHVRCIFAKAGHVWTSGGRLRYSIKLWDESNHNLESVFGVHLKGLCVTMSSIPWQTPGSGSHSTGSADWRLLTAHESGLMYLWDPSQRPLKPLLEIETRKSPIKSLVIFGQLGLMCTAHKDGSVLIGRILSNQMRIDGLSAGPEDDDQIYPFVPRHESPILRKKENVLRSRSVFEEVFPGGLHCAVAGDDCLFIFSNRGEILYWPKEKLSGYFNVLKRSSSRRMPVQVVNESVMVIDGSQVTLGDTIYEGDFASVKRGKFLAKDVIVKEAKDALVSRRAMDALIKDAHILSTIRHPNIVNIMAVCDDPPFVVMQFYEEGSLYDVLKRCRGDPAVAESFTWEKRLKVAIDICCGMVFLHCQTPPILHRDLKSPNVFIEKDFTGAAVGDFNLSKDTSPSPIGGSVRPSNPMWLAPEVANGAQDFSAASDIYAFGIVMWELATARTPWDHLRTAPGMGRELFFGRIRYDLYDNRRPQLPLNSDGEKNIAGGSFPQLNEYIMLMEDCWAGEPTARPPSFEAIVPRLESIKKKLQAMNVHASLTRASAGVKRTTADAGDTVIPRTISEPQRIVTTTRNNDLPPRSPHVRTDTGGSDSIPPSPFDGQNHEDDRTPGQAETGDTGFPASPFN